MFELIPFPKQEEVLLVEENISIHSGITEDRISFILSTVELCSDRIRLTKVLKEGIFRSSKVVIKIRGREIS